MKRNMLTRSKALRLAAAVESHWERIEQAPSLTRAVVAAQLSGELGFDVTEANIKSIVADMGRRWPNGRGKRAEDGGETDRLRSCLWTTALELKRIMWELGEQPSDAFKEALDLLEDRNGSEE